ncbi:MAG: TolC family protein, partial [Deltaproteobacteria bacterium]
MAPQWSVISGQWSGWSKAIKWFFLLSFLLVTGHWPLVTALAQEPISLKELIVEAKANNPELQAFRERVKAKEFAARVAGVLDDPTFKVEIMDIPKDSPKDRPFNLGDSMQTRYTFSQMFPFPGKLSLKQSIALKDVLISGAELKNKELEITAMVKDVYYDYVFINESIKIMHEIKDVLSYMADVAQVKYSTGQVTQQDILKIQTELTMLTNEIISLEAEMEVAEARIKSILNRSQDAVLGDPGRIKKDRIKIDTAQLMTMALQKNPAIKAMEYETQANELNVGLAKKNYYPDFMLGVAPIQRDGRFESWDLMFQVNIPLWRSKYDNQTREAQANVNVLKSRLSAEKNLKGFDVKSAVVKVEAAERITTLYETSLLPQVELSFDSAMKNYQSGKIDFLSLLDAERTLKRTKIEYLNSI